MLAALPRAVTAAFLPMDIFASLFRILILAAPAISMLLLLFGAISLTVLSTAKLAYFSGNVHISSWFSKDLTMVSSSVRKNPFGFEALAHIFCIPAKSDAICAAPPKALVGSSARFVVYAVGSTPMTFFIPLRSCMVFPICSRFE